MAFILTIWILKCFHFLFKGNSKYLGFFFLSVRLWALCMGFYGQRTNFSDVRLKFIPVKQQISDFIAKNRYETTDEWVKIYYANIYYKNTNYEEIKNQIKKSEADIVILVEFASNHEEMLKDFFKENYPYTNAVSWSKIHAGNVVFSKYPIENLTNKYPIENWKWRYWFMKINAPTPFYLYVVHTSAPTSNENFIMRNLQIQKLAKDFTIQQDDRKIDSNVIIVGDFNLSPWSAFYDSFYAQIYNLKNVFQWLNPVFTWSLRDQKLINSHIDHVFTSSELEVSNLKISDLLGSDHNQIIFKINQKQEH